MKRVTVILVATLIAAPLVLARHGHALETREDITGRVASLNLIQQRRAEAKVIVTTQDAQKAIDEGILNQITSKTNELLKDSPSAAKVKAVKDLKRRSIVERGLKLLKYGRTANAWNAAQLRNFSGQIDQFITDAEAVAKPVSSGPTPQEDCAAAKDRCNEKCHATGGGYFCFVDCRLEYVACLISTVMGTFRT